jgi:hypothetical protein
MFMLSPKRAKIHAYISRIRMSPTIHSLSLFDVYGSSVESVDDAHALCLGLHCCVFFTSTSLSQSSDGKIQVFSQAGGNECIIGEQHIHVVPSLETPILHAAPVNRGFDNR